METGAQQDWYGLNPFIKGAKVPIVVQFETHACALCPDASKRISELIKTHHFTWYGQFTRTHTTRRSQLCCVLLSFLPLVRRHQMDATISKLAEDLEVTKLPAIAVIHSVDRYKLYQQLRGEDVDRAIEAECAKRLVLDEDF